MTGDKIKSGAIEGGECPLVALGMTIPHRSTEPPMLRTGDTGTPLVYVCDRCRCLFVALAPKMITGG